MKDKRCRKIEGSGHPINKKMRTIFTESYMVIHPSRHEEIKLRSKQKYQNGK